MNINGYGTMHSEKSRTRRRRVTGIVIIVAILLIGTGIIGVLTSDGPEYQMRATAIEENHILKEQVAELTKKVEKLEKELEEKEDYISALPTNTPEPTATPAGPASPRD